MLYWGDQDSDGEAMDDDIMRRLERMWTMDGIKHTKAVPFKGWTKEKIENYLETLYGEAYTKDYKAGDDLTPAEIAFYRSKDYHRLSFDEDKFEFRRVALTDEQVNDPSLNLDRLDETPQRELNWDKLRKVEQDFVEKHGSLYEVELDGLAIKDQFPDIVADAVNEYFDFDLWEKCVQYEVDGPLPKAEMDLEMLESLRQLNKKYGLEVSDEDYVKMRKKAIDKVSKLRGRYLVIKY